MDDEDHGDDDDQVPGEENFELAPVVSKPKVCEVSSQEKVFLSECSFLRRGIFLASHLSSSCSSGLKQFMKKLSD